MRPRLALCLLLAAACGEPGSWATDRDNLLSGLQPSAIRGLRGGERLTDGVTAGEGADWRSPEAVPIPPAEVALDFDLGARRPICCAVVQGDNNDAYTLEVAAEPGTEFVPLWTAPPVGASGLRTRYTEGLAAEGRVLRLRAQGGDRAFSVAEVAVFSVPPAEWPPVLAVRLSPFAAAQGWLAAFAAVSIAWILSRRPSRRPWERWLVLPVAAAGLGAAIAVARIWPLNGNQEAFVRAALAAIAGVLVAKAAFAPARWALDRRFVNAGLAALCLLGVATYYHFGAMQFRYQSKDRATFVHPWDMRNYFPVAKYFAELRYDGVYAASIAAHLDNSPQRTAADVARVRLRDLTNNQMVYAGEIMPQIEAVRGRFTPERWELFRRDMAELEAMMGTAAYLGSLQDHGGNATPVWVTTAHLLWRWAPLDELTLTLSALIDPALLILLFWIIARTFGLRTMLVALVIFGTTDFSRFGTNLVGSTLRYDWIAALGLGVCALKRGRATLGGVLVAWAGLIRGFPGLAALFLVVPVGYWLVGKVRAERRLPGWGALAREQGPALRAAAGGAACVLFWVIVPTALFSYEGSWGAWLDKIAIHMDKPNVNHVSLLTLTGYDSDLTAEKLFRNDLPEPWTDWQTTQIATRAARAPLFWAGVLFFLGLAVLAARRASLAQAAVLGMFLVPIFFYPANYYIHYIFLLPLAAARPAGEDERPLAWQAAVICAVSVATFPTLATPWADICFTQESAILLAALLLMLGALAWDAWDRPGCSAARLARAQ